MFPDWLLQVASFLGDQQCAAEVITLIASAIRLELLNGLDMKDKCRVPENQCARFVPSL